jgi:hypothetical protein
MKTRRVSQEVRERVLDRIRGALVDGDDAAAMRIAQELQSRWRKADARSRIAEASDASH